MVIENKQIKLMGDHINPNDIYKMKLTSIVPAKTINKCFKYVLKKSDNKSLRFNSQLGDSKLE